MGLISPRELANAKFMSTGCSARAAAAAGALAGIFHAQLILYGIKMVTRAVLWPPLALPLSTLTGKLCV